MLTYFQSGNLKLIGSVITSLTEQRFTNEFSISFNWSEIFYKILHIPGIF
jgi:hypothetical protein